MLPNSAFPLCEVTIALLLAPDGALNLTVKSLCSTSNSANDVSETAVASLLAPSGALPLASQLRVSVSEAAVASLLAQRGAFALASLDRRGLTLCRAEIISQLGTKLATLEVERELSLTSHEAELDFFDPNSPSRGCLRLVRSLFSFALSVDTLVQS